MRPSSREKFTVAIICALAFEAEAVEAHFDEVYDGLGRHYGKNQGDRNCYLNVRIGKHEVVLCYMPEMGKGSAAMVASAIRHSYSNIEIALLVGICGGVLKLLSGQPIFPSDAIIGDSILVYDFGKQHLDAFRWKPNSKEILGGSFYEFRILLIGLSVGQAYRDFQHQMAEYRQRVQ